MKLQRLGYLACLWTLLSGLAAAQATEPAEESASQATASASEQPVEPDKARAYYHFALGHFYQERGALFQRADMLNQAIEELKLALQYDPDSTFLSLELSDLYAAMETEVSISIKRSFFLPASRFRASAVKPGAAIASTNVLATCSAVSPSSGLLKPNTEP